MWRLQGCPRCHGALYQVKDRRGCRSWECINCSYSIDAELLEAVKNNGHSKDKPKITGWVQNTIRSCAMKNNCAECKHREDCKALWDETIQLIKPEMRRKVASLLEAAYVKTN